MDVSSKTRPYRTLTVEWGIIKLSPLPALRLYTVTQHPSVITVQKASYARLLAGLLMVLILHCASFGISHSHRTSSFARYSSSASNSASFTSPTAYGSSVNQPTCECPVCQVQKNLSISLVSKIPRFDSEPGARTYHTPSVTSYSSQLVGQGQGRAPPLTF